MKALGPGDPRQIGPFVLHAELGSGGFGTVFLGRQAAVPGLDPPPLAAVKVLEPGVYQDGAWRQRLKREVEIIERVGGEYTAELLAADIEGANPWFATRFLPALPLHELITINCLLDSRAGWWLLVKLADVLLRLHGLPGEAIWHRDLKPQNLLVGATGIWLIDFGLAYKADGTALTTWGTKAGTRFFMPPEQAFSLNLASEKSDVWSMAATVAFAMTGHQLYDSGTEAQWMHCDDPDLDGVSDPAMLDLLSRCLAYQPADRPSASDVLFEASACAFELDVPFFDPQATLLAPDHLARLARRAQDAETLAPLPTAAAPSAQPPEPALAGSGGRRSGGDRGGFGSWNQHWQDGLEDDSGRYDG